MVEISLTQGLFAIIDDKDYVLVSQFKWCAHKEGKRYYAVTNQWIEGRNMQHRMHRLLMPGCKEVDHINGDGLDNRRVNLRACSSSENKFNRPKLSNNFSGLKGVSWSSKSRKWQVHICANGFKKYLGSFSDKIGAANAYDDAAIDLHGEFAKLNFPFIY